MSCRSTEGGRCISRRALLGTLGGVISTTSGCASNFQQDNEEVQSATESESETTRNETTQKAERHADFGEPVSNESGREVTIENPRLEKIIATSSTDTAHVEVVGSADVQYVVIDVTVFEDDGQSSVPPDKLPLFIVSENDESTKYEDPAVIGSPEDDASSMSLAFEIAVKSVQSATISWTPEDGQEVRWQIPDDVSSQFEHTPTFTVDRFEVPASVEHGTSVDVEIKVTNSGTRDGTFRYELGDETLVSDVSEREFSVERGKTTTESVSFTPPYHDDTDELNIVLDWGIDRMLKETDVT